jgi:hypothetical protein
MPKIISIPDEAAEKLTNVSKYLQSSHAEIAISIQIEGSIPDEYRNLLTEYLAQCLSAVSRLYREVN